MRLIDADKFEKDIRKMLNRHMSVRIMLSLYTMLGMIECRDTIEFETKKHGKWIKSGRKYVVYHCSICNHLEPVLTTDYCSNCGAKMDGIKNECN